MTHLLDEPTGEPTDGRRINPFIWMPRRGRRGGGDNTSAFEKDDLDLPRRRTNVKVQPCDQESRYWVAREAARDRHVGIQQGGQDIADTGCRQPSRRLSLIITPNAGHPDVGVHQSGRYIVDVAAHQPSRRECVSETIARGPSIKI